MKSIGGPNNTVNSQLAQNQKRALDKNISQAQQSNVTTVGRQTNKTSEDEKKTSTLQAPPKEKVTLTSTTEDQLPTDMESASTPTQAQVRDEATVDSSKEAGAQVNSPASEALEGFKDALEGLPEKDIEAIQTQSAATMAYNPEAAKDPVTSLAATALQQAVAKLQAKMPNATAEELKEAAKSDPEIAKWSKIADTSKNYLTQIAAQASTAPSTPGGSASTGEAGSSSVPGMNGPMTDGESGNPFRLSPDQQAKFLADQVKMQQSILDTFNQMWQEIRKSQAERFKLMMQTSDAIRKDFMELHASRMQQANSYNNSVANAILGITPK